ncbi:hypothetical protein M885DRAFT_530834 [Pelagophyceae sp. CCMP2097]|nr:hypothetical protein M885DRAFT_530834 [Pelagophyceae sp. CCMP2097]
MCAPATSLDVASASAHAGAAFSDEAAPAADATPPAAASPRASLVSFSFGRGGAMDADRGIGTESASKPVAAATRPAKRLRFQGAPAAARPDDAPPRSYCDQGDSKHDHSECDHDHGDGTPTMHRHDANCADAATAQLQRFVTDQFCIERQYGSSPETRGLARADIERLVARGASVAAARTLHCAASNGASEYIDVLARLAEESADARDAGAVDMLDSEGLTPLMVAAAAVPCWAASRTMPPCLDVITALLRFGANARLLDGNGRDALAHFDEAKEHWAFEVDIERDYSYADFEKQLRAALAPGLPKAP